MGLPTTVQSNGTPSNGGWQSMLPSTAGAAKKLKNRAIMAVVAVVVLFLALPALLGGGGEKEREPTSIPSTMRIAIVADLDQLSKIDGKKPKFGSVYKRGTLNRNPSTNRYSVEWEEDHKLKSAHSEAGRGMELSELIKFDGRMYTCDDRSGIVFEVLNYGAAPGDGPQPKVVPRHILMEGDGETDKGFKCEWMAVKDDELYIGSFGKEYTNPDGSIKNRNNMWIKVVDKSGAVRHVNWNDHYENMRNVLGFPYPGYMLHETCIWSRERAGWVWLPRRVSTEPYVDTLDEKRGTNLVVMTDENWTDFLSFKVGTLTPERGFSSAKFVPGSREQVVVALKSEENAETDFQASYITVFTMDGETLLEEEQIPGNVKYEGIEFL